MLAGFAGRYVVVRTLDAGADKPLRLRRPRPGGEPGAGRRGLRLSQARPELLEDQLAALAAAAQATGTEVRVMAPMVATPAEARWFAERCGRTACPRPA